METNRKVILTSQLLFSNQDIRLSGTLHRPNAEGPHPCVIVLHGARGGLRSFPFYQHLTTRLPAHGIALLLFDRRGSGESTGNFETSDFTDLAADAAAGFNYLCTRPDIAADRIFLYGISQGAWIVPNVAVKTPDAAGLIMVSGSGVSPADQMDYAASYTLRDAGFSDEVVAGAMALRQRVNEYFRGHITLEALRQEIAAVENEPWFNAADVYPSQDLPQDVTASKWYYEMDYDPLAVWQSVRNPALFIVPGHDRWVPIQASMSNYRAATAHIPDVTFAQIPGADHLMAEMSADGTEQISERYIAVLLDWLDHHR